MKLESYVDYESGDRVYRLRIGWAERVGAKLYSWDHELLSECGESPRVSDTLLGLELLARRIEETEARKGGSAS